MQTRKRQTYTLLQTDMAIKEHTYFNFHPATELRAAYFRSASLLIVSMLCMHNVKPHMLVTVREYCVMCVWLGAVRRTRCCVVYLVLCRLTSAHQLTQIERYASSLNSATTLWRRFGCVECDSSGKAASLRMNGRFSRYLMTQTQPNAVRYGRESIADWERVVGMDQNDFLRHSPCAFLKILVSFK